MGWTAVTAWAATTAYSVGDLRRQLAAPAVDSERVFRCTTAGTSGGSEPAWSLTKGATTADNTAVWTEVTGNSTYNWTAPHARLLTALGSWAAAGDSIYVAHNHAETSSAAITLTNVGTAASPTKVICVNSAGSVPPVSADLATTATITTTGNSNIQIASAATCYFYGIGFSCGTGAVSPTFNISSNGSSQNYVFNACSFNIAATGSSALITIGNGSAMGRVEWTNCTVSFGATGHGIVLTGPVLTWKNTASAITGATIPTSLFIASGSPRGGIAVFDGVDLSAAGSGKTLVGAISACQEFFFKNCKLGGSVTIAATPVSLGGAQTNLLISDSADTHNRQERYTYAGTLTTETTIVRTSGASDGDTSISHKIITTANAKWAHPFECFQIAIWNTSVGSSKTATLEIVNDGVTLQDDDIWMDVEYLGTSGFPLASVASTRSADILNTGTNLTTSSVTWTTTGLSSPVKQYMQATFTPQEIGYIRATVYVAKASQTVYIDPVLTIA